MSDFDFDSFQDQPPFTSATTRPNLLHHQPSYPSTSRPNSRLGSPLFTFDDSFFQDALADDSLADQYLPTPDRFAATPPNNFLDTILNPQSPKQREPWDFSQFGRRHTPTISSSRSFDMSRLPNGYVDLTADASSPPSPNSTGYRRLSKRNVALRASPEDTSGPSNKRQKRDDGAGVQALTEGPSTAITPVEEIEEINLVDEEDKVSLQTALQKQRIEQVRAQEPPSEKPLRLSNLTCVICMDSPTDITATSCGHLFCHTCLMEALIAGENRTGPNEPKRSQCPVCRKVINRNKTSDVIPLLMMLKKGLATQTRKSATPKS